MNLFEPSSSTLTEKKQKREDFKTKAKASGSTIIRLSKQLYPQWLDETVTRATYVAPHNSPPLDVSSYQPDKSNTHTGVTSHDETSRKQELVRRTLAGETFQASSDTRAQLETEQRQLAAYEATIEHLSREIEHESNLLREAYARSLEPQHRDMMVKLCKAVVDVHAAYADVHGLKCHLIDSNVNLRRGLCNILPSFLGNPSDSFGDMAAFLTAAKQHGWIKEIPNSLKMKAFR